MATKGIDFETLSLKDALDLAVLVEEEARDRYAELTAQLELHHTPAAAAFFKKMVRVEEQHREELEKRRLSLFAGQPVQVSRAQLFDIEAPDYDEVREGMTPRAALETAMRSEAKAEQFFAAALPRLKDPKVRALFEELRKEEVEHQQWVQAELDRLPKGEDVPGDASDEPVAH